MDPPRDAIRRVAASPALIIDPLFPCSPARRSVQQLCRIANKCDGHALSHPAAGLPPLDRHLHWIPNVRTFLTCLAVTLSTIVSAADADERPLEISVYPRICSSPCTVRVTIRAERHVLNRELVLELDSPAYFRSSLIVLDGSDAALIHERLFEFLEAGPYEARVVLRRFSQEPLRDRVIFDVVGPTRAAS